MDVNIKYIIMKVRNFISAILFISVLFAGCAEKGKKMGLDDFNDNKDDAGYEYLPGEVKPAGTLPCFAGAYYRKVVSSTDHWLGIGGKVVLPKITFDQDRKNPDKFQQYLDNPSVYLGGNANGQETDIGMTWEVIRDQNGAVTTDRRAFRPFLRRTGYQSSGQQSNYMNAPAEDRYYWYEGDEIEMSVKIVRDGWLLFTVEGMGKKFQQEYQCDGYKLDGKTEFKRVNAIDQVANEGKPVQSTKTRVENSEWKETYLYRNVNNQLTKAYMHPGRFTDMRCPSQKYHVITDSANDKTLGAEKITIDGGR